MVGLKFGTSCLNLSCVRIAGVCHHTQLVHRFKISIKIFYWLFNTLYYNYTIYFIALFLLPILPSSFSSLYPSNVMFFLSENKLNMKKPKNQKEQRV